MTRLKNKFNSNFFVIFFFFLLIPAQESRPDNISLNDSAASPPTIDTSSVLMDLGQETTGVVLHMISFSWADSVILYDPGAPGSGTGDEPDPRYQNALWALGPPDFDTKKDSSSLSLGRGGTLILKFLDNVLFDGPGPDLIVIQTDSLPEDVFVWISQDGEVFIPVGKVSRTNPEIDISANGQPGLLYPYVKLRDDQNQGEENSQKLGADIDAVGALHSVIQFEFPSDSLFERNTSLLRDNADRFLSKAADQIRKYSSRRVLIEAYTDNPWSKDFNFILSQEQAESVKNYFLNVEGLSQVFFTALSWGEEKGASSDWRKSGNQGSNRIVILLMIKQGVN